MVFPPHSFNFVLRPVLGSRFLLSEFIRAEYFPLIDGTIQAPGKET